MLSLAFWALVLLDLAGMLLLFVLGLAAGGSSGTHPLRVAFYLLLLPALPLAGAVWLHLRAPAAGRALALVLAAAPLLVLVLARTWVQWQYDAATDPSGRMTYYGQGPLRELAQAIARDDAAAAQALLPRLDVNARGLDGVTPLVLAARRLRQAPAQHDILRQLLAAGARPDQAAQFELPLAIAIQTSGRAGSTPVRLLLDAGADPNQVLGSAAPVFFQAVGRAAPLEVLGLLLERGAKPNARDAQGATALIAAAQARNWAAAQLLLQRGADPQQGRSVQGHTFKEMLEREREAQRADPAYQALRQHLP